MTEKETPVRREPVNADKGSSAARLKDMVTVLKRHGIIHGVSPEKLRLILEDLGPTYIKLGQMISMRSDLLPRRYCDALAGLRANVKPIAYEEIIGVIEAEYGLAADEIFSEIVPECIGSASIAQVHQAVLKDGTKVVIKVQRPNIYHTVERDIQLLKKALGIIQSIGITGGMIDFKAVIDEMWAVARQEMNFLIEADHIEEFINLNSGVQYVAFPRVERQLTTPRVLVLEYVDGVQIDNDDELKRLGYDLNEIGLKLAENYVKQVVDDGFFHADPHPGNIWIRDGKIVWLDLGMVGRLTNRDRMLLKKGVAAVVYQDIDELKKILLSMGNITGRVNHARLYEDIHDLLDRYGDVDLGNLHFGQLIAKIIDICKEHQISMPQGIALLGRGVLTIESVLAACSPRVNIYQIMANHISGARLNDIDAAKELYAALKFLYGFTKRGLALPAQISNILAMALRGQTKVNMELTGSEGPLRKLDDMVDKLVVCIISAALLIGSSLICTTDMTPRFFGIPFLGAAGYMGAMILSGLLIAGILKKQKKWKRIWQKRKIHP
jgi:ubiquinone biosynthesis protein